MLEGFFSLGSAAILVRMGFQSSCLVSAFDLGDVGVWFNAQDFVMCPWRVMGHFECYISVY